MKYTKFDDLVNTNQLMANVYLILKGHKAGKQSMKTKTKTKIWKIEFTLIDSVENDKDLTNYTKEEIKKEFIKGLDLTYGLEVSRVKVRRAK